MIPKSELLHQLKQILKNKLIDYVHAKKQAEEIDYLLGFQCQLVEEKIVTNINKQKDIQKNLWSEIHVQSHQTPYSELLEMMQYIEKMGYQGQIQTAVDFGAGYGRLGIILKAYYPSINFIGYEISEERVNEAKRVYRNIGFNENLDTTIIQQDISNSLFNFPTFDLGYIYDFGTNQDIQQFLDNLKKNASDKKIIIVARGKAVRHFILNDHPWLSKVNEPYHTSHWSIFRS